MPFRDRTGPWGRGSGTGFGLGSCGGYSPLSSHQYSQQIVPQLPSYSPYSYGPGFGNTMQNSYSSYPLGQGMGQGLGMGMGFGRGFGGGFGPGFGYGRGLGMGRGRGFR